MSYLTYVRLFKEADAELREIQPQDALLTSTKPIENRTKGFAWLARHYLKYISIINKLGLCYDQMIDPLRLSIMKKLLDASVGRYMEIKSEMVREEVSDFHFLDTYIIERKMTIHDAQIMVPRYYRNSRLEELNKMNETIDRVLYEIEHPKEEVLEEEEEEGEGEEEEEEPKKEESVSKKKKEKHDSAPIIIVPKVVELPPEKKAFIANISMIQRHERARTSRLNAQKVKEIKRVQDDIAWHRYVPIPDDVMNKAVQNIQRFWRSYAVRLRLRAKDTRMRILIGELQSSYSITPQKMAIEHVEEMRRRLKKGASEEWQNAIINANERLLSAQQREDIGDELRYFILHWYRTIAELPEFPEDDMILPPPGLLGLPKGTPDDFIAKRCPPIIPIGPNMYVKGSALIVAGFWVAPELYELAYTAMTILKKQKAGSRPPPKLTKEQRDQLKQEAKEKALEQKKKLEEDIADKRSRGVYPVESKFLKEFKERLEESRLEWRVDEPIKERAGLQVMKNVHFELRELVDDVMREELLRLQKALDKDRSKKPKDKDKEKKKKNPKKKRGKRVKDPTKNRTLESLFEELAGKGVIKKYPYVNLDDLFGDYGYAQSDFRGEPFFQDPWPKYGDVRQVVKEYCILNVMAPRFTPQLGPRGVNPAPIRSVLLFGPPHSGKRLLADGVCTHLGAVKFDLTPANLKGKVADKKDKKMLVHMVSKVSRLLQPSVIFIDGGEKPFYGKVPKEEKASNPRLLKADIPKLVKEIKPEDQVIFLATSNFPWMGSAAKMKKTYEKMLPVMRPDYGTIYNYLSKLLMAYHGVDRDFFTSSLARMSERYPLTVLKEAVEAVLVPRRIVLLKTQPLSPLEIYEYLLTRKEEKLTPEQEQKYRDWWDKTYKMAINKKTKMAEDAELRAKMAALKDAEKKKKKK